MTSDRRHYFYSVVHGYTLTDSTFSTKCTRTDRILLRSTSYSIYFTDQRPDDGLGSPLFNWIGVIRSVGRLFYVVWSSRCGEVGKETKRSRRKRENREHSACKLELVINDCYFIFERISDA